MSESQSLLADTVARLFADLSTTPASFADQWQQVADMGLPLLMIPEADGGFGGDWPDLFIVQRAMGANALALPLGETILANHLRHAVGQAPLTTAIGVSVSREPSDTLVGQTYSGQLHGVPWGRLAQTVLTVHRDDHLVLLDAGAASITASSNLAGEPRDTLVFTNANAVVCPTSMRLHDQLALMRLGQITGALERALSLTVDYVKTRVQFGKPIGSFQAVQQQLAIFAEEVAATTCAVQAAHLAGHDNWFAIACAKIRANQAIGIATATAHQLHGAIGFTQDYGLHPYTRRLWAWRSEYGNDHYWSARLGAHVAARGADQAWPDLTAIA